jgi:hypothetical protein
MKCFKLLIKALIGVPQTTNRSILSEVPQYGAKVLFLRFSNIRRIGLVKYFAFTLFFKRLLASFLFLIVIGCSFSFARPGNPVWMDGLQCYTRRFWIWAFKWAGIRPDQVLMASAPSPNRMGFSFKRPT